MAKRALLVIGALVLAVVCAGAGAVSFPTADLVAVARGADAVAEIRVVEGRAVDSPAGEARFRYVIETARVFKGQAPTVLESIPDNLQLGSHYLLVAKANLDPLLLLIADMGLPERDGRWVALRREFEVPEAVRKVSLASCVVLAPGSEVPLNLCVTGFEFLSWNDLSSLLGSSGRDVQDK